MTVSSDSPFFSPGSSSSSPSGRRSRPHSLDLSSVPVLAMPRPPSNTLLITNLLDLAIFRPDHLLTIRDLINQLAPIHTWSPLKSFLRIVVSFYDIDAAIRIREVLDGEAIMGERVRVYFGEPTPVGPVDCHLHAPESRKLFFISPPPSPPHGWEVRHEGPPNKQVHPDDLVSALSNLRAHAQDDDVVLPMPSRPRRSSEGWHSVIHRGRSGSTTMIYDPIHHGNSPHLPAIAVQDLTYTPDEPSPLDATLPASKSSTIMSHTARPPLELIQDS